MPPPIVTSLPWLSRNIDPVATYQRSQQLVQAMEAQRAKERQEQAELAQRAQEAAMQAQFQQRSLALKEQEARSGVQVEADRLRQRGQAMEFEQKAQEAEQRYRQAPSELVDLGGGVRGVRTGYGFQPLPKPGALAGMANKATPVYDASGKQIGNNVVVSENSSVFRALPQEKPSAEEIKAGKEDERAKKFQLDRLVDREKELKKLQPGTIGYKLLPDDTAKLTAVRHYGQVQKQLDAIKPREAAAPPATPAPVSQGVRVRRKSDGKILLYQGNKADVKLSEFDIVE